MKCPYCGHPDSRVVDSRAPEDTVRRRRECPACGQRFTTYERVQSTALLVVKRDGRREEFNREKVKAGILKACAKRPVSVEAIERIVGEIERELARLGRAEVPSSIIGQMVMDRLRFLDHVAYVRFASVYRNFQDLESFKKEVETLLSGRERPRPVQPALPLGLNDEKPVAARKRGRKPREPVPQPLDNQSP